MLSEKLMWSSQVELPISKSFPASSELDAAFEELQIECRTETALEKRRRITIDERIERWTLFGYTLVVAAAVISSVIAMASSTLGVLEIAFFMPLITGPFVIHQKDGLIKCRKKREVIASLRLQTWRMKEANDEIRAEVDLMQKEVYRLKIVETKLKDIVEKQGHNFAAIYDLFRENKELNKVKKELAEAIGFQNLMTGILRTDTNRNHIIGDVELNLLAFRIQSIEGVPFTGREMIDRFGDTRKRSLATLVDVVQELYVEKRREQTSEKAKIPMDGTTTKLGSHLLWKRRFDFNIGMAV